MCIFQLKFGKLPTHSICDWHVDCVGCRYNSDTTEIKTLYYNKENINGSHIESY